MRGILRDQKENILQRKNRPDILHRLVWVLYFLLLVAPAVIGIIAFVLPHTLSGFNNGTYKELSRGFSLEFEDGTVSKAVFPQYFDSNRGDRVIVNGRIPQDITEDSTLFVFSEDQDVIIYVDGKRVGTYMGASKYAGGGEIPDAWYTVPLHADAGGKRLRVIISAKQGKGAGYLKPIYLGDKTAVIYRLIEDDCFPVISGILMALIGLMIAVYSMLRLKKGGMEYVYFGTFMLFFGAWFFFRSDIRQVYLPAVDYAANMAVICLIMMHFPLLLLTAERIRKRSSYYADEVTAYALLFGGSAYSLVLRGILHRDRWDTGMAAGFVAFGICGIIDFRRWLYEENAKERRALVRSEEKTAFMSDMSHAIRTPANTVLGMDTMILRKSSDSRVTGYANDIANACQSLLSIIDDILDFSKTGSGEIRIQSVNYSLRALIADCYNMIVIRAERKGLDFSVNNDQQIPDSLMGDEMRVRQIIVNLLTNAVKYTESGSVELNLDFEQTGDNTILLYISVRDTGIGIREENMPHLFESYRRIEEGRNTHIEGTGLGLAITKHLVSLMGGEINVESTYGRGSVFHVSLPQKTVGKNTVGDVGKYLAGGIDRSVEKVSWFRAPEARVLVVDDVEMNLKVMEELLGETGMNVDTAESGKECLEKVAAGEYDLIFLDHMMPEMDGEETFRRMNAMSGNKNRDTHVIMLTANAIKGAKEIYLKEGFSGYLAKPVKEEELKEICLAYLPKGLISMQPEWAVIQNAAPAAPAAENKADAGLNALKAVLDTEAGMSNSMNDIDFYIEILHDYVEKNRRQKLEDTYSAKDWEAYRISVHSLKSTSRTIGAAALGEEAYALEMAARDKDAVFIKDHHAEMMAHYEELLGELQAALDNI